MSRPACSATTRRWRATCRRRPRQTGELLWRLPLGKAYEKHIKSDIADLKNVGRAREAGSTAGAVFLQQFIGDVPWAHLDIAATPGPRATCRWPARAPPATACGCSTGWWRHASRPRLDRGRLLPSDPQHARAGAAAGCSRRPMPRATGCWSAAATAERLELLEPAACGPMARTVPAARHEGRRFRRAAADLSHGRGRATPTGPRSWPWSTAPRRPISRPSPVVSTCSTAATRRRWSVPAVAGARRWSRGIARVYWQQTERGGWSKAGRADQAAG